MDMDMETDMLIITRYSSIEVNALAELAKTKGLVLFEGNYEGLSCDPNYKSNGGKGYGVAMVIAGQYLTLTDDGYVYQDYNHDGPFKERTLRLRLTWEQAKDLIENFNGTIKNYPNFFAYIRVYDGEPEYYGQLQMLYLEAFAHKHGFTYKEKIVCTGGKRDVWLHPEDTTAIDDVISCCKKSFSQIGEGDFLVVADTSRLNDELYIWRQIFDIISVGDIISEVFYDMGYTQYNYHESEKLRERIRYWEKYEKDVEYEAMSREYREMMLEIGEQPCLDVEEEI